MYPFASFIVTMLQHRSLKTSKQREMILKWSVKKNSIYCLIHIDFQIQEIFTPRLAHPINIRDAHSFFLSDLQLSREIFPVSESQCGLIAIFSHFSRILPLQVHQRLFSITLKNLQEAVFRQRSIFFSTEQIKIKAPYVHFAWFVFGHALLYDWY